MDFQRARTKEQIEQRQLDIMRACEKLYERGGYDQVNLKAISEMTTINRSSIYNYYKTKDEIILDLLREELIEWKDELLLWANQNLPLSKEAFAKQFTQILTQKNTMLQYYCLLYTLLELNCGIDKLVSFKKDAIPVAMAIVQVIHMNFPEYSMKQALFLCEQINSYVLGVYPATHLTQKQKEACMLSGTGYQPPEFISMCEQGILAFLNMPVI